jgi:hypothetical protein
MLVKAIAIDEFHGIKPVIGVKITPEKGCEHCQAQELYVELGSKAVSIELVAEALESLAARVRRLKFSERKEG